jgi:hypothetical protein
MLTTIQSNFTFLLFSYLLGSFGLLLGGHRVGIRGCVFLTVILALGQGLSLRFLLPLVGDLPVYRVDYGPWFSLGSLRVH